MKSKCVNCGKIYEVQKATKMIYCEKCKKWCANSFYNQTEQQINTSEDDNMAARKTQSENKDSLKYKILTMIAEGKDNAEIAKELNCRKPYVSLIRKQNKKEAE